jgi:hypothetical protein
MDLYFVMTPTGPVLCKYRYLVEHGIEHHRHRYHAFVGPGAQRSAAQFLESTLARLYPAADIQVAELVIGPYDHRMLTMR